MFSFVCILPFDGSWDEQACQKSRGFLAWVLQGSEHESVQHHSHETEHGREENLQIHVTISHVKMSG